MKIKLNSVEAKNAQLGQCGSFLAKDTSAHTPKSGVIVAITATETSAISALVAETDDYVNTAGASTADGSGNGDALSASETLIAGVTVYGRWTSITLGSGAVWCYLG
jgi:hypothetical protein|tara:strand:- start:334 stop:654 length:321 start_codon:yes stop_codon:yes gene_type:complete